jgi:hypothetical protein
VGMGWPGTAAPITAVRCVWGIELTGPAIARDRGLERGVIQNSATLHSDVNSRLRPRRVARAAASSRPAVRGCHQQPAALPPMRLLLVLLALLEPATMTPTTARSSPPPPLRNCSSLPQPNNCACHRRRRYERRRTSVTTAVVVTHDDTAAAVGEGVGGDPGLGNCFACGVCHSCFNCRSCIKCRDDGVPPPPPPPPPPAPHPPAPRAPPPAPWAARAAAAQMLVAESDPTKEGLYPSIGNGFISTNVGCAPRTEFFLHMGGVFNNHGE